MVKETEKMVDSVKNCQSMVVKIIAERDALRKEVAELKAQLKEK